MQFMFVYSIRMEKCLFNIDNHLNQVGQICGILHSAVSGDTSQTAAEREVFEEIGYKIDLENVRPSLTVNFEHGFDDIYLVECEINIDTLTLQYDEVQEVKWASIDEIKLMIDDGSFIPYHKSLIELLFFMRKRMGTHMKNDNK